MILRSQVPLGDFRTDNGGNLMMLTVFLPKAHDALGVAPQTTVYSESSVSISLPLFLKMLYEGNIIAHCALWSPFYEGDDFPREDLLNQRLITSLKDNAKTDYDKHLAWRHAKDISLLKKFILDRKDWQELDAIKYATSAKFPNFEESMDALPKIEDDVSIYTKILKTYYSC